MKRKIKKWLLALGALLIGGMVVLNLLAYRHACAMMHFTTGNPPTHEPEDLSVVQKLTVLFNGVNLPRPQCSFTTQSLSPECRAVTIACTNGVKLGAWYCQTTSSSPLVILFHGYVSQKTTLLPEAKAFLGMGCSVLLVDFRGSGESSESYTTIGVYEAEDVAATFRYAQTNFSHPKMILYGQSMGAAAILRAVHSCDVRPDAIIAEAVFNRMLTTVKHRFEAMDVPSFPSAQLLVFWGGFHGDFNGFAHNPVEYAARVRCPILFLHGAADPRARFDEAREVFEAVPGAKSFKEFPGLRHAAVISRFPDEWKETLRQFISTLKP